MRIFLTTIFILITSLASFAQTGYASHKAGHEFNISIPEYMTRTIGLNNSAIIQFKNSAKDVYAIVIEDNKEELKLADLNFAGIDDFYAYFIKDFLKDEQKRKIGKAKSKSIGAFRYIESEASYYDTDIKEEIYYLIGVIETKTMYYKLLCYTSLSNKDAFKSDFQKILYSIND